MINIILATLNARFIHARLGLRYLFVNLDELRQCAQIAGYTIDHRPTNIAEKLLAHNPRILGRGIYIWNVEETTRAGCRAETCRT